MAGMIDGSGSNFNQIISDYYNNYGNSNLEVDLLRSKYFQRTASKQGQLVHTGPLLMWSLQWYLPII